MLPRTDRFYINGEWVAPHGGGRFQVINPATELPVADLAMGDAEDVHAAVTAAKAAFDGWASTSQDERKQLLTRLLDLYEAGSYQMATLITTEMGVAITLSHTAQVPSGRAHLKTAIRVLGEFKFKEQRGNTLLTREPVGVCALITPWNWPMNQLVVKVAAALTAGCTMVAKPSVVMAK